MALVTELSRDDFPFPQVPGLGRGPERAEYIRKFRAPNGQHTIIEAVRTVPAGTRASEARPGPQPGAAAGTVQVGMSTERSYRTIVLMARYAAGGTGIVVLMVVSLHLLYLRRLLRPLKLIIGFARRVRSGDRTPAPAVERADELGELAGAFSEMVQETRNLQDQVAERSRELQDEVSAKERARLELVEAQHRLIELSRQSGMAEVATGVLHNVGNVLNSLNVSATVIAGRIAGLRVDNLVATVDMLQQHRDDLKDYVDADPKGSRLLPYLAKLGMHLQEERRALLNEVEALRDHVGHITEIVAAQQNYAKASGLVEEVSLPALVGDALRIVQAALERHDIHIERLFAEVPDIPTDKHKVLQILLNILRNAKQAIHDGGNSRRVIRVRILRHGTDAVRIEVSDTGVGLARENLTRIFAHGFTTKRDGHGFGLHSSALAAQEIGGALWAESDGPGLGSTFILRLPLRAGAQSSKGAVHEIASAH